MRYDLNLDDELPDDLFDTHTIVLLAVLILSAIPTIYGIAVGLANGGTLLAAIVFSYCVAALLTPRRDHTGEAR